jgi:DNA-binding GntR family transcriptional regulator
MHQQNQERQWHRPVHATDEALHQTSGELSGKLPSERSLAEEYECAYTTVRRAMEVLRDEGTVITRQGRGPFVR